ncbi:MAG TPA: hypothetical protein VEZ47_05405 [Gemmatirosa sp.]|nr:hypothetical protein [Gemmatirosa sp.]
MTDPSIDALRAAAEALMEDVSRVLWQASAGLGDASELDAAYARHPLPLDRDSWALVRPFVDDPALRPLAEWVAETQVARATATHEARELEWERGAVVRADDGRVVEYGAVTIALANARDRRERLALDAARARVVGAELAPLRRERLARERDALLALEVAGDAASTLGRLAGVDVGALDAACAALLADTQAMWDDVLPAFARRRLDVAARELTRADALALSRAPEFDAWFPAGGMVATVRTQLGAMGLDPDASGRVRPDVGERPGKRARAFCAPVRVPHEVHLVVRPGGGAGDWRVYLHEMGHALHFAHIDAALPFEARWAGDNSVTEGYAMLFDHLLHDRGWLVRYLGMDRARADAYRRSAAFDELHLLRRYAGKLRYELALHGGDVPWDALPGLYADTLRAATGFAYRPEDALVDVDPRLYAMRYLRAWPLEARLAGALRERFDEDWWRNPRAGPWLAQEGFAAGQREPAEALVARLAGGEATLAFAPVVRGLEAALA